jgi:HAE1 family hydrophobic/amphiphilic exporter-1
MGLVAASIVLLMFFMKSTPTGMVPNEDTGTIMGAVTLPPGTSQERAMEVLAKVDSLVAAEPAVESRTIISGYSFIGGQGPSYGSVIIKLKDWEERSMMQNSDIIYATLFMRAQKIIKDAQVLFFAPPMIPGYSVSSDIELNMQDKTGGSLDHFFEVVNNYRAALEARPEINSAKTTFNPSFPVMQNLQFILQPTCEDTHKVARSSSGIYTDSTKWFSPTLYKYFTVPSTERISSTGASAPTS